MDCSYHTYFIQSKWYIQLTIFIVSSSLLGKHVKSSPVLTMSRKCEKLNLQFPWKALLPRNKLKLCFQKINCLCELTLEPFNNLTTARPKVLTIWLMKFKLNNFSALKKIKNVDWQINKQINAQVKLHFEKTNHKNKIFS